MELFWLSFGGSLHVTWSR